MECQACHTLCQLNRCQCAYVSHFTDCTPALLRLQEQGMVEGTEVEFVRRAPLGGPLEVRLGNIHITLRASEAATIHVRVEDGSPAPAHIHVEAA